MIAFSRGIHSVAVAVLLLSVSSCGGDWQESYYPTRVAAEKDGEFERGWLPEYLPASSRDIHELHRIEHPKTWGSFAYNSEDLDGMLAVVTKVDVLPPVLATISRPGSTWWPDLISGSLDMEALNRAGFELYVTHDNDMGANARGLIYLFILDRVQGRGYFFETVMPPHSRG